MILAHDTGMGYGVLPGASVTVHMQHEISSIRIRVLTRTSGRNTTGRTGRIAIVTYW